MHLCAVPLRHPFCRVPTPYLNTATSNLFEASKFVPAA
nr:MAG TPA: hypothetical protein [Caudoviricetes sp.]